MRRQLLASLVLAAAAAGAGVYIAASTEARPYPSPCPDRFPLPPQMKSVCTQESRFDGHPGLVLLLLDEADTDTEPFGGTVYLEASHGCVVDTSGRALTPRMAIHLRNQRDHAH